MDFLIADTCILESKAADIKPKYARYSSIHSLNHLSSIGMQVYKILNYLI